MRWLPTSIRTRVLASSLLVLALVITFFTLYLPSRQLTTARNDIKYRTLRMAQMVSVGAAVGLELNQLPAVASVVTWAKENPSLAFVVVADTTGRPIGAFNPRDLAIPPGLLQRPGMVIESSDLAAVAVPVVYRDHQLGSVLLGLSTAQIRAEATQLRLAALLVGLVALVIGGFLSLYLANRITEPIRRLEEAAVQVSQGRYDVTISRDGADEVGRLGEAFGSMVDRVRVSLDDLEANSISLAEARDQALAAVRTKADFLATMSHEIRTPMNGVLGMLSLLNETPLTTKQAEFVRTASTSANALLTIIDDILDFSKIEAGKLELEQTEFDLRETVDDVARLLAERAHARGLELVCLVPVSVPTRVQGDPVRLRQILLNLGGNAIKFTSRGEVRITVTGTPAAGGTRFRFEVADTGIGIAPSVQQRLFQPFTQAESSTTRRFGGTGLGLSICHRLVQMMGGEIGVESEEGHGSVFWFTVTLPALAAHPVHCPLAPGVPVLVVAPHAGCRAVVCQYLRDAGLAAAGVADHREAWKAFEAAAAEGRPHQAVIIDGELDGTAAAALVQRIRRDERGGAVRVILMCAAGQPDGRIGADPGAWIMKPVRYRELLASLCRRADDRTAVRSDVPRTRQSTGPQAGARILVAEDNEVNQMLAQEILTNAGHKVDVVGNGQEALDARFAGTYDVILMDCQMPVMDGHTATRLIRQRERSEPRRSVPIIALTANAIEGDREACLASGMDDYLSKPFTPTGLLTMLNRWTAPTHRPAGEVAAGSSSPPLPRTDLTPAAPAAIPALDMAHLAGLVGGDATKTRRYIDMFIQLTGPALAELVEACAAADLDRARRLAHKIKGSCGMVGARPMAAIAGRIEHLAGQGDVGPLSALATELETAFDAAVEAAKPEGVTL